MASFDLTPGSWTEVIASGGSVGRVVQIVTGKALISLGAPDASATYISASAVQNKEIKVPAGVAVSVRAETPRLLLTTGDY